jgi:hypothetical protein
VEGCEKDLKCALACALEEQGGEWRRCGVIDACMVGISTSLRKERRERNR